MDLCDIGFSYDDEDIISDSIFNFYNSCDCRDELFEFMSLYTSNKKFYTYIQKNCLINKVDVSYLLRLFNDYEENDVVDDYDYISCVNTTRWI